VIGRKPMIKPIIFRLSEKQNDVTVG